MTNDNFCLHCSEGQRVQVSCDTCHSFICVDCCWGHEFQANHEIRVCDRCDSFLCKECEDMDQCHDCGEVACKSCGTLLTCKFCGSALCEECATACAKCGIVLCGRDAKFAVDCDTCKLSYCLICLADGQKDACIRCHARPSKRMEQLVHLRLKFFYAFQQSSRNNDALKRAALAAMKNSNKNGEPKIDPVLAKAQADAAAAELLAELEEEEEEQQRHSISIKSLVPGKEKDTLAAQKWREVQAQQEAFSKKGRKKTEEMSKVGRGNVAEQKMAEITAQQEAFAQKGVKKAEDQPKVGRGNVLAQEMASIIRAQQKPGRDVQYDQVVQDVGDVGDFNGAELGVAFESVADEMYALNSGEDEGVQSERSYDSGDGSSALFVGFPSTDDESDSFLSFKAEGVEDSDDAELEGEEEQQRHSISIKSLVRGTSRNQEGGTIELKSSSLTASRKKEKKKSYEESCKKKSKEKKKQCNKDDDKDDKDREEEDFFSTRYYSNSTKSTKNKKSTDSKKSTKSKKSKKSSKKKKGNSENQNWTSAPSALYNTIPVTNPLSPVFVPILKPSIEPTPKTAPEPPEPIPEPTRKRTVEATTESSMPTAIFESCKVPTTKNGSQGIEAPMMNKTTVTSIIDKETRPPSTIPSPTYFPSVLVKTLVPSDPSNEAPSATIIPLLSDPPGSSDWELVQNIGNLSHHTNEELIGNTKARSMSTRSDDGKDDTSFTNNSNMVLVDLTTDGIQQKENFDSNVVSLSFSDISSDKKSQVVDDNLSNSSSSWSHIEDHSMNDNFSESAISPKRINNRRNKSFSPSV